MQSSKTSPVQQEETTQQWKVQVIEGEEEKSPKAVDIDRPLPSPNEGKPLPDPEESKPPPPPSTSVGDRTPLSCPDEMTPLPTTSTIEKPPSSSTLAIYTEIPEMPEECVHSYSNAQRTLDGYVKPQCEQHGIRQVEGEI